MKKKIEVQKGITFSQALTIVFITLKLIGQIDWSWWWVLSPLIIYAVLELTRLLLAEIIIVLEKRV